MKGFGAFLDMKRCKDWDHEISSRKYLRPVLTSFPGAQSDSSFTLNYPQWESKVISCSSIGFNLCRQMANAFVAVVVLASANSQLTGKCQFVVDNILIKCDHLCQSEFFFSLKVLSCLFCLFLKLFLFCIRV